MLKNIELVWKMAILSAIICSAQTLFFIPEAVYFVGTFKCKSRERKQFLYLKQFLQKWKNTVFFLVLCRRETFHFSFHNTNKKDLCRSNQLSMEFTSLFSLTYKYGSAKSMGWTMNEGVRDLVIEENLNLENGFDGLSLNSSSDYTLYDQDGDVEMEPPSDLGFVEFTNPDESELQASRTYSASGDFFTGFKVDTTMGDHSMFPASFGWTAYEAGGDVDMEPPDDDMFLEFSGPDESDDADGDFFTDSDEDVIMDDDFVPAEYSHQHFVDPDWYDDWDDL